LPQGLPKKIQFHLLLADLALQITNALRAVARSATRMAFATALVGRHAGRKASGPPRRKCMHHLYKWVAVNPSSPDSAVAPSPAIIRFTAESLNSRLKTRRFPVDIGLPSRKFLVSVSHFRGALHHHAAILIEGRATGSRAFCMK